MKEKYVETDGFRDARLLGEGRASLVLSGRYGVGGVRQPVDLALGEVRRWSGKQFDPAVVKALDRAVSAGELAALERPR